MAKRLIQAKEDFRKACEIADRELLVAIETELQVATSDGDFERAKRLTAVKEAYQKDGVLPTDDRIIRSRCGSPRLPDCGAVFHTATAGA